MYCVHQLGICILNAMLFPGLLGYHQEFRLRTKLGLELTNCLEIHTLELPKYPKGSHNMLVTDPLDQWMDFFRNALGATPSDLKKRLSSPIFDEAIGVLEMISRTPEQRRYYNARLKLQLDENTRRVDEEAARSESEARGRAEGEARGRAEGQTEGKAEAKAETIQLLQSFLGEQPTKIEVLRSMSLKSLDEVIVDLQTKLHRRLS